MVLNDEMLLNSQINSCNKSPVSHICISSKLPQWLLCFLVWPLGWLTGLVACCRKRCSSTVGVFSSAKVKTGNLHSKGYKALFQAKHFFFLHLSTFLLYLRSSTTILSFSCISKEFKDNQRDLIYRISSNWLRYFFSKLQIQLHYGINYFKYCLIREVIRIPPLGTMNLMEIWKILNRSLKPSLPFLEASRLSD